MKSIVITGAGTGLGKELALLFSRKEYHIVLIGRRMEKLQEVEATIKDSGGMADSLSLDITDQAAVKETMARIASSFSLYGLINNAGIGHFGPFEELTGQEVQEMLSINLLGTIYMTQSILPHLKKENEGLIMNIISTAGLVGKVNETGYCASKFAVRGLTESLQKEYAETGISIKAVYMGGMDTPFWDTNGFVSDRSGLRSSRDVAEEILAKFDQDSIEIDSK